MTVKQVIDLAKASELTGLPVASKDETVLGFINLGVLELYKRFTLSVEEWIIALEDGQSYYTAPEDFMWIIAAYGEVGMDSVQEVNVLPVNEEDNPLSINTVGWNKVQVPLSVTGAYVSIIYAATPEVYGITDMNKPVNIPPQMIEALLAYIGWRANSTIDTGIQTEDTVWYNRFESSCSRLEVKGFINANDMVMTNRLNMRGFV